MWRPDQRGGHGRLRLASGARRLLAPSLLHLQRLQRAAGRPDLLLPRREDLLWQAPRRVPQAPLRSVRRGKSQLAPASATDAARGGGLRGSLLPARWYFPSIHPGLYVGHAHEIRWLRFVKGSCKLCLRFQVSVSGIFSCSLPGTVLRPICSYTQGAEGAETSMSVCSNSAAPVLCDFSPAVCGGPPFPSLPPEEASGGWLLYFLQGGSVWVHAELK